MIARLSRPSRCVNTDTIIAEVARQAFEEIPNIVDLFDEHDNLRPLHTLTLEQQRSIAGLDVVKRNLVAGDKKTDMVQKIHRDDMLSRPWSLRLGHDREHVRDRVARHTRCEKRPPRRVPRSPDLAESSVP
jgi:hypothetical protein